MRLIVLLVGVAIAIYQVTQLCRGRRVNSYLLIKAFLLLGVLLVIGIVALV